MATASGPVVRQMNEQTIRWQEDEKFCKWLLSKRYAEKGQKGIRPFLTNGVVLFMYEAWCARMESYLRLDPLLDEDGKEIDIFAQPT
jgi:hypothetical protein